MKIPKIFRRSQTDKNLPTVVVFAGGMGTQILQASVYFSMKSAGRVVYADLSYFNTASKMAEAGNPGQLTHWFWQLDQFGLPKTSFDQNPELNTQNADILSDGAKMMALGLKALAQPDIQKNFKDVANVRDILSEEILSSFLCIHVRRGDYVNVASHLISDHEFINLIKKFSGLIDHVVILSDSPISSDLRNAVSPLFISAMFLDSIDPYASHQIMRCARVLICSNSTFSLTAAALNPSALIIMPKKWFAEKDRAIEEPIHAHCTFQIMQ